MSFIRVKWREIKKLSPRDMSLFIRKHFSELKCEDRFRIEKMRDAGITANAEFIEKFFSCEIMQLARKQAYKQYPEMEILSRDELKMRPLLKKRFWNAIFKNADKILKYKTEQVKQQKRRAKRKPGTKTERYRNSHPWMKHLYALRARCNNPKNNKYAKYGGRGIKALINAEELKAIWLRDKADKMTKPSIDRINPDGHYEVSNCRFIELKENCARCRHNAKPINLFTCDGKFLKRFKSFNEARRAGYNYEKILDSLKGLDKSSEFVWRYAK